MKAPAECRARDERVATFRVADTPLVFPEQTREVSTMSDTIQTVAVLGAGTMGAGIAQVCANAGMTARVRDLDDAALEKGRAAIEKSLARLLKKERISEADADSLRGRIAYTTDMKEAVEGADLVVEAVPEKMELKLRVFAEVQKHASAEAIFASNTSSLSVTEIAASTDRPERCIGLHFFNPVPVMKLLEVVKGMSTSEETVEMAKTFSNRIGKEAVIVNDWPGFATSRLGIILGCEAIRMVEQGVAEPDAIDRAMELGYRHPMGPLRLTDLVGLDVRLAIMEHLHRELGEQFRPPALLRQMVRAGKLGRKSGEGFYVY